jgi:alpha-D-ribose 1-methylphosphonate 5-triphosphate diphosphatase PhnM
MNTFIMKNVNIITGYSVINNGYIYVKRGIIQGVGRIDPGRVHRSCVVMDGKGGLLFPGFIDICNRQLSGMDEASFFSAEKALYRQGVTSVFHMVPGCESMDGSRLNQLRRLGVIRHHFISKPSVPDSFRLISASALNGAIPSELIHHPSSYIVCSNSTEASFLQVVNALHRLYGVRLEEAIGMAGINPARATGIEGRLGSIEWGKRADLVLADSFDNYLYIRSVFVSGCEIYDRGNPGKLYAKEGDINAISRSGQPSTLFEQKR